MVNRRDLNHLLTGIAMDLSAMGVKLTELRAVIASLELPDPVELECSCGIKFKGTASYSEHVYHAHNGPVPAHWLEAEARAKEPAEKPA